MARSAPKGKKPGRASRPDPVRLYTLEVVLLSGPLPEAFTRENPVVERTLQLRGGQTLADLHRAIFEAFGRTQEQMYEFQLGRWPGDPEALRYVLPGALGMAGDGARPPAGSVADTPLDALGLEAGRSFSYWFDFAADWWHQILVESVDEKEAPGKYPRVTKRVGADPPQSPGDGIPSAGPQEISGDAAADMSCLIGEMHLRKGDYGKAVEAFTRAIEGRPTPDAYLGRARAYREMAAHDERRAQELS